MSVLVCACACAWLRVCAWVRVCVCLCMHACMYVALMRQRRSYFDLSVVISVGKEISEL